jgi:integrase
MILARLIPSLGPDRSVDGLDPSELRAWLVELRTTLAPVSVAGYVRTLRVLGNWLAAEGLAKATALRGLRRPHVPHKVIEPVADDVLRRLLGIASIRDRAIVLLMIGTGLRVSEVAGLRLRDLRPDGRPYQDPNPRAEPAATIGPAVGVQPGALEVVGYADPVNPTETMNAVALRPASLVVAASDGPGG